MTERIHDLYAAVQPYLSAGGKNATAIPYMEVYCCHQKEFVLPDMANPYLLWIVNGHMRLHVAEGICDYLPGQYFISAIDSPRSGELLSPSEDDPFVALRIEFSVDDVISVMLDIDGDPPEVLSDEKETAVSPPCTDERIMDTLLRLFQMTPVERSFMGKHLKREIIFDLIMGRYGRQFMQAIVHIQQAGDIYDINNWIKQNYKADFSVEDLAGQSNMSLSTFHQKFKSAVGMGPLQCQKKLRLMEARRLMLDHAAPVTDAALEVGYESVSQFIRDYRRMFGRTPQKDVQEIRARIQAELESK